MIDPTTPPSQHHHQKQQQRSPEKWKQQQHFPLSQNQINEFLENGILVVDNVFSQEEINHACEEMASTLQKYRVDVNDLKGTGHNLKKLSSTNGSGGVLDIFYPQWKFKMAMNPTFFSIISQLWQVGFHHDPDDFYDHNHENKKECSDIGANGRNHSDNDDDGGDFKKHPYGPFHCDRGYIYVDRIGYRIPTTLAEELGMKDTENSTTSSCTIQKKKRTRPIQRSLTPHLDCCPDTIYSISSSGTKIPKWRPLQSFISLTDNEEHNTGGFEAVPGFHRIFSKWAKYRKPSIVLKKGGIQEAIKAPCVGQFTPIRPKEDKEVLKQIIPISCKAGSVVIWDNRIPHGNSRRNDSQIARAVVYASFLPDVELNRVYVKEQWKDYQNKYIPSDQWIEVEGKSKPREDEPHFYAESQFERNLMGIEPWK